MNAIHRHQHGAQKRHAEQGRGVKVMDCQAGQGRAEPGQAGQSQEGRAGQYRTGQGWQ